MLELQIVSVIQGVSAEWFVGNHRV
jgi:hypothetical protein